MRSFIFVFIGVTEHGTDADIGVFQARLKSTLAEYIQKAAFSLKGDLLTLTFINPGFQFFISFERNGSETIPHWKNLANNFELPWDIKPVDELRLTNIFARLEAEGWSEYRSFQQLSFIILSEMEKFKHVKVFTIPSMAKRTLCVLATT